MTMVFCNRDDFQETVQELSELLAKPEDYSQVVWKVEYLSRTDWYHFYGMIRSGVGSGVGHLYDRVDSQASDIPFDDCVSIALGFHTNAYISTYSGQRSSTTDILEEVETRGCIDAEVVRFGIEARTTEMGGRKVMAVTDIAFVGLRDAAQRKHLTGMTSDAPSLKWCRDRRFISASPIVSTADFGFVGL